MRHDWNKWDLQAQELLYKLKTEIPPKKQIVYPPEVQAVLTAAEKLVIRMDTIQSTNEYQSVWVLAHNHGMPYTGDNWKDELDALRVAIAFDKEAKDE